MEMTKLPVSQFENSYEQLAHRVIQGLYNWKVSKNSVKIKTASAPTFKKEILKENEKDEEVLSN